MRSIVVVILSTTVLVACGGDEQQANFSAIGRDASCGAACGGAASLGGASGTGAGGSRGGRAETSSGGQAGASSGGITSGGSSSDASASGGVGGSGTGSGGAFATGGTSPTGGTTAGGNAGFGGAKNGGAAGADSGTPGTDAGSASGGASNSGGSPNTGGVAVAGGTTGTGGVVASGGTTGTGGTGANGQPCELDSDCQNAHCVGGTCCAVACDAPGKCQAFAGTTCPGGSACDYGFAPNQSACDDGDPCTSTSCFDGACTIDSELCGPIATACSPCAGGAGCFDGRLCTCPNGVAVRNGVCGAPCVGSSNQVVIIGDSYVTGAASPALQPALATFVPSASGFRNFAVPASALATGGLQGFIPGQFDQAVSQNPDIKLVIMDGGFSDITLCDSSRFSNCTSLCKTSGSSTQSVCANIVSEAVNAFERLLGTMANEGVSDVVYFFVPHFPASGGGYSEIFDYAATPFSNACSAAASKTGGRLACHFVDLRAPFAAAGGDMNPANFVSDGMHPSDAGQKISAGEIAGVLNASCLAKTAQSGCCAF